MPKVKLRQVANHLHATQKGDYWFDSAGHVLFNCPWCGEINVAINHKVIQKDPLTLEPSVVEHTGNKHHFFIRNGYAE